MRRGSRSILFYAWGGLAVQGVLVVGVIAFVLVGASHQSSAISALHRRAQNMQLANFAVQTSFQDSQRALRGYEATGQQRFMQTYYTDQDQFALDLHRLRGLAWRAVLPPVRAQAATASAVFRVGDRAITARPGRAGLYYARASAGSDRFVQQNEALQRRLGRDSDALAAQSGRTLGVGLAATSAILGLGLMLPMVAVMVGLRQTSRPLNDVTRMVRERSVGDYRVRAVPGGPADVRDLANSINVLADESDRLRSLQAEQARLQRQVWLASARIREHLHASEVIKEAVTAIQEHLVTDLVWVGLVKGEELEYAGGRSGYRRRMEQVSAQLPEESVRWTRELYHRQASYCIQDLGSAQAQELPAEVRDVLRQAGAASLLVTPFGAGPEPLGLISLVRNDPGTPWTAPEISAAESLAADVARGVEHARLYENEEHLVAELQNLDRAKASFLASASHDLRTPLTSILGYVEILADEEAGPLGPQQAKMLGAVGRNARRLQTLIEDMLTISKIELGDFTSDLEPTDLASLLPEVADVIRPSAREKGLEFAVSGPGGGLLVDGDSEQLYRVLVNLLSNAVKYTPSGSVRLTATRADGCAVISVADTGIGIPEQEQQSVFNRFFRASNAMERAVPGSGLGLSIVHTIISNHHGEICVTSKEGAGTTVVVRIPLREGGPAAAHTGEGQAGQALAGDAPPAPQADMAPEPVPAPSAGRPP